MASHVCALSRRLRKAALRSTPMTIIKRNAQSVCLNLKRPKMLGRSSGSESRVKVSEFAKKTIK